MSGIGFGDLAHAEGHALNDGPAQERHGGHLEQVDTGFIGSPRDVVRLAHAEPDAHGVRRPQWLRELGAVLGERNPLDRLPVLQQPHALEVVGADVDEAQPARAARREPLRRPRRIPGRRRRARARRPRQYPVRGGERGAGSCRSRTWGGPGRRRASGRLAPHPRTDSPSSIALLETALDASAWHSFSRGSAIRRAGRAGFARNVCVALGNWGSPEAVPVLTSALSDPEPLVRAHAAWALGRVGSREAGKALSSRLPVEREPSVASEIGAALDA